MLNTRVIPFPASPTPMDLAQLGCLEFGGGHPKGWLHTEEQCFPREARAVVKCLKEETRAEKYK